MVWMNFYVSDRSCENMRCRYQNYWFGLAKVTALLTCSPDKCPHPMLRKSLHSLWWNKKHLVEVLTCLPVRAERYRQIRRDHETSISWYDSHWMR